MKNIKLIFQIIIYAIIGYLLFDFLCAVHWIVVGQTPPTGFFFGWITQHIFKIIF